MVGTNSVFLVILYVIVHKTFRSNLSEGQKLSMCTVGALAKAVI